MRLKFVRFALAAALMARLQAQTPVPAQDQAKQAFDQEMKLAQAGDVSAMYVVALDYLEGVGVEKDLGYK